MTSESLQHGCNSLPNGVFHGPELHTAAGYERELARSRRTAISLRASLARDEELLRQKDEVIQRQALLSRESDHRLLNDVQMIVSLLSLQSRASANPEVASQLAAASDRVAAIGRVHRRLHSIDGDRVIAFKQYLEDLSDDVSVMMFSGESRERAITVEGIEIDLPAAAGIPLAFIANELITNAVKYGNGRIAVALEAHPGRGCILSVSNDGVSLRDGFDPAASKGLGMKIVRSLVARIGGELQFGRSDMSQGVRFSVLIPADAADIPSSAQNSPRPSSPKRHEAQQTVS